jgi:DNA-nicking Smr family endonuclease
MPKRGSGNTPRPPAAPPAFTESAEFRIEVADAIPLPPPNLAQHVRRKPKPIARQRQRDEQQVMHDALFDPFDWDAAIATGNELLFVRPGVPNAAVRKLKRGGWVLRAELDLHGMNGDEARMALAVFLHDCMRRELRCVRIIHGKGLGSRNREPVLKYKLRYWLMQRDDVLAFCQARQVDGGSGAVVVLLKSPNH